MSKKEIKKVFVIDDDKSIRWILEKAFTKAGYDVNCYENTENIKKNIIKHAPNIIISDIRMPGESGLEMLENVRREFPKIPIIIMTAFSDLESTVSSLQKGAYDYITKPFDIKEMISSVEKSLKNKISLESKTKSYLSRKTSKIIGSSESMQDIYKAIGKISSANVDVMILGETGTGKELIAKAIHENSDRKNNPFIAINTGAIPTELLESELFGHEKGSFTGAINSRAGRIEQANGGTLFLDEIGDMPISLQSKLLRVLEEKTVQRIGSNKEKSVDFRLICATHQNLQQKIDSGEFRSDLFFRINVFPIDVPNLSTRAVDIPIIIESLLSRADRDQIYDKPTFDQSAIEALSRYDWPGNIRELKNVIERASVIFSGKNISGDNVKQNLIKLKAPIAEEQDALWEASGDLDLTFDDGEVETENLKDPLPTAESYRDWFEFHTQMDMRRHLRDVEIVLIEAALQKSEGMVSQAADLLRIRRTTLIEKIKKFVIEKPVF